MSTTYSPSEVRDFVLEAFSRLTRKSANRDTLEEVLLVRDGVYSGRSYRWGGWMANWMISVGVIAFYNQRGDLVRTIDLHEAVAAEAPVRRAA
jgi:hypothetical protein